MGKEKSPARGLRAEALGMGVTLQKERQKGPRHQPAKRPQQAEALSARLQANSVGTA